MDVINRPDPYYVKVQRTCIHGCLNLASAEIDLFVFHLRKDSKLGKENAQQNLNMMS